jgi:hypothetical protein
MPASRPQNLANHRAIDNIFIGCVLALFLLFILAAVSLKDGVTLTGLTQTALIILLFPIVFKIRLYATRVQTRIIRTEMYLRLRDLLDAETYARARTGLTIPQLVALRFAGDAELPALLEAALADNLSNAEIKKRIKDWQADWFRV